MKIYLDGSKHLQGQVNRIGEGFIELGHELTDYAWNADIIYSNNPSPTRTQLIKDKLEGKLRSKCKIISTILDYPIHLEDTESFKTEVNQIKLDLCGSDAVCSISEYTQKMVKEKYNHYSTVIYNPQKPTKQLNFPRNYFGCIVGRKQDKNKNVLAVIQAMRILGIPEEKVLMVGNESVGWGNYCGVLSDEKLNEVYNSCLFSFSMGEIEGLNLVPIEAASVGCIPIINSKLTTREELFQSSIFPEYLDCDAEPVKIANLIVKLCENNDSINEFRQRITTHYNSKLSVKFNKTSVAQKILDVYKTINS